MRQITLLSFILMALAISSQAANLTVTSAADSGAGSLRAVLNQANSTTNFDTIRFNITPAGRKKITLFSPLPVVEQPVVIRGDSQPLSAGEANNLPNIELSGENLPQDEAVMAIVSNSCTIVGLAFTNYRFGTLGLVLAEGGSHNISQCHFSVLTDGVTAAPNAGFVGVYIQGSSGNTIGGATTADRCVFGNHSLDESIAIFVTESNNTKIQNCHIGVNQPGTVAVANNMGIYIEGGSGHKVLDSVISGNRRIGMIFDGCDDSVVQGSKIGTDLTGSVAIPNSTTGEEGMAGIIVTSSEPTDPALRCQIGGTTVAQRNIISGNGSEGLVVTGGADGTKISGNYVGINAAGTQIISNQASGVVLLDSVKNCIIGGTTAGSGNVISGNLQGGIVITGVGTDDNKILGNIVGLSPSGNDTGGNVGGGIVVFGGPLRTVIGGGVISGFNTGNLISANDIANIWIYGEGSNDTVIEGNKIGTDITGQSPRNDVDGLTVGINIEDKAKRTRIGLSETGTGVGNVISGNSFDGILLSGAGTNDTAIRGNLIGVTADGKLAIGNGFAGIALLEPEQPGQAGPSGTVIGGTLATHRNIFGGHGLFAGNGLPGPAVLINDAGAVSTKILNNYFGLGGDGVTPLPNIYAIAAKGGTSTSPITIGAAGAGNVVANSLIAGIFVGDGVSKVIGNRIGVTPTGTAADNEDKGLVFSERSVATIGGTATGEQNLIWFNGTGLMAEESASINISANSFHANKGLAIDLKPGDTEGVAEAADALDEDVGPNGLQNALTLASVTPGTGTSTVFGTLQSEPSRQYRVNIYEAAMIGNGGRGQGKTYLGSQTLTTDAAGNAELSASVPNATSQAYTCTVTLLNGDGTPKETSEFSNVVEAPNLAHVAFATATSTVQEQSGSFSATISRSGTLSGSLSVVVEALPVLSWGFITNFPKQTIVFANGETTKTVTGTFQNNAGSNIGLQDIVLRIVSTTPATSVVIGPLGSHIIKVIDDEPTATVSLSSGSFTEGNSGTTEVSLTLSLSSPAASPVLVLLTPTDGTAKENGDYLVEFPAVTIPAGALSATVKIGIIGDALYEPTETFSIALEVGGVDSPPTPATITIVDNDVRGRGTLQGNGNVSEGNLASFSLSLEHTTLRAWTVNYTVTPNSAESTDFTSLTGSFTVPINSRFVSFSVPTFDDNIYEGSESFTVSLQLVETGDLIDPPDLSLATSSTIIIDNESQPVLNVTNQSRVAEGSTISLRYSLSRASEVEVSFTPLVNLSSQATSGVDFTLVIQTVTIPAGQTTANVTVSIATDTLSEPDESVAIAVVNPSNALLGTAWNAAFVIEDASPISLIFSQETVTEPTTGRWTVPITITFSRTPTVSGALTLTPSSMSATADLDFDATPLVVPITAGASSATALVPILADSDDAEKLETLELRLSPNAQFTVTSAPAVHIIPMSVVEWNIEPEIGAQRQIVFPYGTRQAYTLQSSVDLVKWSPIITFPQPASAQHLPAPPWAGRFYRFIIPQLTPSLGRYYRVSASAPQ